MFVGLCVSIAHGRISATGDVDPADPTTWTSGTDAFVGRTAAGSVTVDGDSDLFSRKAYLGYDSGSTGTMTVSDVGSLWTNHSQLQIGRGGNGTLAISNGGVVKSDRIYLGFGYGTTGAMTVSGAGSTCINSGSFSVGNAGHGTLEITDGGAVTNRDGIIGRYPDHTDTATVSGAGSKWTSTDILYVGGPYNGSRGMLTVTDGGAVNSLHGFIGYAYASTGAMTVSGEGSTFTTGTLSLGQAGNGTLEIANGGTVSNNYSSIGYGSSNVYTKGAVTVSGAGSTWSSTGRLTIGWYGDGRAKITDGGLVIAAGGLTMDDYGDTASYITMAAGGMLALAGDADDSLVDFLGLIEGRGAIRYWDDSISDWADITGATAGEDYTLAYVTAGDLASHTVLTVTAVPEPATLSLLTLGGLALVRRRKRGMFK